MNKLLTTSCAFSLVGMTLAGSALADGHSVIGLPNSETIPERIFGYKQSMIHLRAH